MGGENKCGGRFRCFSRELGTIRVDYRGGIPTYPADKFADADIGCLHRCNYDYHEVLIPLW